MAEFYSTLYHDVRHLFFSFEPFSERYQYIRTHSATRIQSVHSYRLYEKRTLWMEFFGVAYLVWYSLTMCNARAVLLPLLLACACMEHTLKRRWNETKWWCARNSDASDTPPDNTLHLAVQHFCVMASLNCLFERLLEFKFNGISYLLWWDNFYLNSICRNNENWLLKQ